MLKHYYRDFIEVLEVDINTMLQTEDPKERSNKRIKEYLEMLADSKDKLRDLEAADASDEWAQLSPEARTQIDQIIENDLRKSKR